MAISPGRPKMRVLVADDLHTIRYVIVEGLKGIFYNMDFDEAKDGQEAQLKMEKNGPYDLIIADLEMPKMKGTELLKWIRSTQAHKNTPFIMITAYSTRENLMETISMGINGYIVKPFTINCLSHKISAISNNFDRRQCERLAANNRVNIRQGDGRSSDGNLSDISRSGMAGIFPRDDNAPNIMDDLEIEFSYSSAPGAAKTVSLGGRVLRVEAAEGDRESLKVAVNFNESRAADNDEFIKFLEYLKENSKVRVVF